MGRVAAVLCLVWLAVLALPARAEVAVDFGRYYALVIGINDYDTLPKLESAVNDASAVHDVLRRQYGFKSTLLLNPRRYELVRELDRLRAELTPADNLLIYYAGHGILDDETGDGYWLPADAEEDSQANWVPVYTVTSTVKAMSAKHVLVVSDSCYSGTLTREAPALLATGGDRAIELQRLSQRRSRKALTSGALEPVADGGGDGHSVFARAFLDTLRSNAEVLDGYNLYTKMRRQVVVNAKQTPKYSDIRFADDEGGDFLFVPVGLPAPTIAAPSPAAPPQAAPAVDREALFWSSIKDSSDAADFDSYLQQYPNGAFAPLARNRLAAAQRTAALAPAPQPAAPPPQPSPTGDRSLELAYWNSIKDSSDRADFESYLQQYPNGAFAPLARNRLVATATATEAIGDLDGVWEGEISVFGGPGIPSRRTMRVVVRDGKIRGRFPFGFLGASYVLEGRVGDDGELHNTSLHWMIESYELDGTLWEGTGSGPLGWEIRYDMEKTTDIADLDPKLEREIVEGPERPNTSLEDSSR